ncbi:hypothetical protein HDU91_003796, partial [Kappamyces sp. JEL0680]
MFLKQKSIVEFVSDLVVVISHQNDHCDQNVALKRLLNQSLVCDWDQGVDQGPAVANVRKKLLELQLSLSLLENQVDIPSIRLALHPQIKTLDPALLNSLQSLVNEWIKEIQKVTLLTRDPASGSTRQELEFWIGLERCLLDVEAQLKTTGIVMTLELLKKAKRFHATVSFIADTGIKDALERVQKYNLLMKEFPLEELLSAMEIDKLGDALNSIFSHFIKKIKISPYPIHRALPLAECISKDLNAQVMAMVSGKRLLVMPANQFAKLTSDLSRVFELWDDNIKEFVSVAREMSRKRSEKFIPIKVASHHTVLQERLNYLVQFRNHHDQLVLTIEKVVNAQKSVKGAGAPSLLDLGLSADAALSQIHGAMDALRSVDALDISPEGVEGWNSAEALYNSKISSIEHQIISKLRDLLAASKSASDMFGIFSRFNALFVRPKIRGAIHEYQTQLIERVKEDMRQLHSKFMDRQENIKALAFTQARDIPSLSGSIIWAKGIERQLGVYMKKVEYVLGKGWEQYAEGQKLQKEELAFRRQLDTSALFSQWVQEETSRPLVGGPIFCMTKNRLRGNRLELGINFDAKSISLFKDVRNLIWLGFPVPLQIQNIAKDSKRVYPFAVSLDETLRIYQKTLTRLEGDERLALLVASYQKAIQDLLSKGLQLRWDYFINTYDVRGTPSTENRHVLFVSDLATLVSQFQEKAFLGIKYSEEISSLIAELGSIRYDHATFSACLDGIQKLVDKLNFESFSNVEAWTAQIDTQIEAALMARLAAAVKTFTAGDWVHDKRSHVVHRLKLQDQVLLLEPSLDSARAAWMARLHDCFSVITRLARIRVFTYDRERLQQEDPKAFYSSLLPRLEPQIVRAAYQSIQTIYDNARQYTSKWLEYQTLWDVDPATLFDELGDDLDLWVATIKEIKEERSVFDNTKTEEVLGPITIQYGAVQTKVNGIYDKWQRDILNQFSIRLGNSMSGFYSRIKGWRSLLERPLAGSLDEVVDFVVLLGDLESKVLEDEALLKLFQSCQRLLERQRFSFPSHWVYFDQLAGEWSAFKEIVVKKRLLVQKQTPGLKEKALHEAEECKKRVAEFLLDWETNKPIGGDHVPQMALKSLDSYALNARVLHDRLLAVNKAQLALDIDAMFLDRITPVSLEISDLQEVWQALDGVWNEIESTKQIKWTSDDCWKVRGQLEALLTRLKGMPNAIRQYLAFQFVQERIQTYLACHSRTLVLKSEALRDRHWDRILSLAELDSSLKTLTVGQVWDATGLRQKERQIEEIVQLAQGEMALEEFLKQVRSYWSGYSFEFVNFQNKCRLVKGWDDMMNKAQEHLVALGAMKNSAHFVAFKEHALHLEDELTKLYTLLECWMKVQRQWVYLQGVFSGNHEIKLILPMETSRFASIDAEFMGMLRKVYKSSLALDVVSIPNIQTSMVRLHELLGGIQKSLGEYLEQERSAFARFYFIADEDLLEILGNSKDITRIEPHLKKMFPAISKLLVQSGTQRVVGVSSIEGEELHFAEPVELASSRINDWLSCIEQQTKSALQRELQSSLDCKTALRLESGMKESDLVDWINRHPLQILVLSAQIQWCQLVEGSIGNKQRLQQTLAHLESSISLLAVSVITEASPLTRKKCESLLTELVHERDVTRDLVERDVVSKHDFLWLSQLRFYADSAVQVTAAIANASFRYGFEYLGVQDRLVQTPLTDRCYLTLAQALHHRLGGSPFGPAGTGKTESVKSLASQLGRQCLVFCCDEGFDFQSMGRIFVGLCQVGAWGCFDEFNRLEENILSAVSQQIQAIQGGLKTGAAIELVGKSVTVNESTGIFITMNPGYAGRSDLPDNLTTLFRAVAMTAPDRKLIAQVMLFSQGFRHAESLASKAVPFFEISAQQLSGQQHYDFGLRALKSVLVSAGKMQRQNINASPAAESVFGEDQETAVLVKSIRETVFPKLIVDDIRIAEALLVDIFGHAASAPEESQLVAIVHSVCKQSHLNAAAGWIEKIVQLYNIQEINHGIMIVGPAGTGKSLAWKVLFKALDILHNQPGFHYIIDAKSLSKEKLYGWMDSTTRTWTDGVFTSILRDIVEDVRGMGHRRHWIVFDGDVDPEWIENLNSVLDDNKVLTLPNGERLPFPPNCRLVFEVENLDQATPATVSRCGMVWFPVGLVTPSMQIERFLSLLEAIPIDEIPARDALQYDDTTLARVSPTQRTAREALSQFLVPGGLVEICLAKAAAHSHVMEFSDMQGLSNFFALLTSHMKRIIEYDSSHPDFPMTAVQVENFMIKSMYVAIGWAFAGDLASAERTRFGEFIVSAANIHLGNGLTSIFDVAPDLLAPDWISWKSCVPAINVDAHALSRHDLVIPTIDTMRHESILYSWLAERKSLILCGPPGSGKTMTLLSSLRKLPDADVVPLNFSSETSYDLIIKTLEIHCQYHKSSHGDVLSPKHEDRWLILFCDEINLPKPDKYGTQRAIMFLRQLIQHGGFWKCDRGWIQVERVQIIGACNPPTDSGRVVLSQRFLRQSPVVLVDYPAEDSLLTIYGTLARACLKSQPLLRGYSDAVAAAMIRFYLEIKSLFTPEKHAHYIYSPRELTRWIRGVHEIIRVAEFVSLEVLVRVWAHEALRLFQDRLADQQERELLYSKLCETAALYFPSADLDNALASPIYFSDYLSQSYESNDREALADFIKQRVQTFYEEELDTPLVLFDMALDHILRLDRVFRQVQGHMLLIGISGSGKSTLTRFVAWMNGAALHQPVMHAKYSISDFDDDLKVVLKRAGCKGEKICLLLDESNIVDPSFLERINTLLANSEIPGLFDGDELGSLLSSCRESASRDGAAFENHDELYDWFTKQVARNLHVVFTMNPPNDGLSSKATSSPALFNRCVLNWMGDWNSQAFYQVGLEFTSSIDVDQPFECPKLYQPSYASIFTPFSKRDVVLDFLLYVHNQCKIQMSQLSAVQNRSAFITPRHYLDFVSNFTQLYEEKRSQLEERQRHVIVGLDRLQETLTKVQELRSSLAAKSAELEVKSSQANEKLKKMVDDQQNAEKKRIASVSLQKSLAEKYAQIEHRKSYVKEELSKAEPAVVEAQESVSSIKKQHLTEVRSMGNPPNAVKLAMESVCILLGHKASDWKSVQAILRRDDFISSIVNYDTGKLAASTRNEIANTYLSDPNYSFDVVNRASKACGPLVNWVVAQVGYASILEKVEPLRDELEQLEQSALTTEGEAQEAEKTIEKLEHSISIYKEEYALLISDVQMLKKEMESVSERVDRSIKVLDNLSSERERWSFSRDTFGTQMGTLVGDSLLSSAYLTYAGFLDQGNRSEVLKKWKGRLDDSGLAYQASLSLPDYLSSEDERRKWTTHSLPPDRLCQENAIMMKRALRYPFIIDPSNQALVFIKAFYKNRNLLVTSFRDANFLKTLESALRFGNPILIQDAEVVDAIINPILNKEIRKSGGRSLCRLGTKDVDFSPTFTLFLISKNTSQHYTADVSSRVTFVNFTTTRESLMHQCLDRFLCHERPDIDAKRRDLLRMQGEFQFRLHHLEKALLDALNESTGNILEDEKVL